MRAHQISSHVFLQSCGLRFHGAGSYRCFVGREGSPGAKVTVCHHSCVALGGAGPPPLPAHLCREDDDVRVTLCPLHRAAVRLTKTAHAKDAAVSTTVSVGEMGRASPRPAQPLLPSQSSPNRGDHLRQGVGLCGVRRWGTEVILWGRAPQRCMCPERFAATPARRSPRWRVQVKGTTLVTEHLTGLEAQRPQTRTPPPPAPPCRGRTPLALRHLPGNF